MERCPIFLIAVVEAFALLFVGCSSTGGNRYMTVSSHVSHLVEKGVVVDIHNVMVDGKSGPTGFYGGAIEGAVVGGAAGADISKSSRGAAIGIAAGTVVGAAVGPKIQKAMSARSAQELTIELEEGKIIVVVQERREPDFNIGEKVRVYSNAQGSARVYHHDEDPYIDPDTGAYLPEDFENPDL